MFTTFIKWSVLFSGLIVIQEWFYFIVDQKYIDAFKEYMSYLWLLDGFLPVQAIFNCILAMVLFELTKLFFNIVFGFIGLFAGSGKPEI